MVLLLIIALGWGIRKIFGPEATQILWLKCKWLFAFIYLWLLKRRLKPMFPFDKHSKQHDKTGLTSIPEAWRRENPRILLDAKESVDSVNIWGADELGNALMVRVARRHGRISEVWIYLRLQSGEEYQSPVQPDLRICNTDGESFSAKGLHFEILEPLRRWRIGYNGTLRKDVKTHWDPDEDTDDCSVQFNFVWHPMYSYSAYPSDFNPKLLATSLAKHQWGKDFINKWKLSSTKWHNQWGQMHGTLTIDQKPSTLLLTGTKMREYGVLDWKNINKKVVIRGIDSIGTAIDLYADADANGQLNVYHGEVSPPCNRQLYSVSQCSISNADTFFMKTGQEVEIDVVADNRKFHLKLSTKISGFPFFAGDNWDCHGNCKLIKLQLNDRMGYGLVETYEKHNKGSPLTCHLSVFHLSQPNFSTEEHIVTFKDKACMNGNLVGGKGASLAMMTTLSQQDDRVDVPPGFSLTKACFEHHLKENISLELAIYHLEDVAWKRKEGSLLEESAKLSDLISNSILTESLQKSLASKLQKVFGEDFANKPLAVRSSAIGEDGNDLSAAGQNETFLGVKGFEEICKAVIKCWASQFSYRSVEYKRQNGQLLNGGMAVVVQEMVSAEVAGVLFSRDPLTGNFNTMTISANYGLGESVVSAAADPDNIILNRSWSDELSIANVIVGKKETKCIMSDNGGTLETKTEYLEASKCCVTDIMALKLGRTAIELEKHFGSSRDIEWALRGEKIYLLQARPITSGLVLTDFEVMHEFDVAFRTTREMFTTANVAEVFSGALSPLYITANLRASMLKFMELISLKSKKFRFDPTVSDAMPLYTNHILTDVIMGQAPFVSSNDKAMMEKACDVNMYGRVVDSSEMRRMAKDRYEKTSWAEAISIMTSFALPGMFKSRKIVESNEKKYLDFPTPGAGIATPLEAYHEIMEHLSIATTVFESHAHVTIASILWNGMTLILLSNGTREFSSDVYSDFASLIGRNNETESGEVPLKLQEIVKTIKEEDVSKKFVSLTAQESLHYMMSKLSRSSALFQQFLKAHGHRGLQELDVKSVTWGMEPTKVVKMLQAMLQNTSTSDKHKTSLSIEEIISTLKTPLTPLRRKLLRWLVGRTIESLRYRERAKSMLVRGTHIIRLAFRHLASIMLNHGFIPEEDLVFFMTVEEIGELIKTRSARIIMRARRRQRLNPFMNSLEYPEIIVGLPKPINDAKDVCVADGTYQVKGYPVCHGRVKGIARVITSFDQVNLLMQNDILITHATDIVWSPYFPMLGGVVTEIGGLISHGAVIAREYGLPCIIDAANATKIFKSGDEIILDATEGTVTKLSTDLR